MILALCHTCEVRETWSESWSHHADGASGLRHEGHVPCLILTRPHSRLHIRDDVEAERKGIGADAVIIRHYGQSLDGLIPRQDGR